MSRDGCGARRLRAGMETGKPAGEKSILWPCAGSRTAPQWRVVPNSGVSPLVTNTRHGPHPPGTKKPHDSMRSEGGTGGLLFTQLTAQTACLGCLAAWLLGCLAAWLLGCLALCQLTPFDRENTERMWDCQINFRQEIFRLIRGVNRVMDFLDPHRIGSLHEHPPSIPASFSIPRARTNSSARATCSIYRPAPPSWSGPKVPSSPMPRSSALSTTAPCKRSRSLKKKSKPPSMARATTRKTMFPKPTKNSS